VDPLPPSPAARSPGQADQDDHIGNADGPIDFSALMRADAAIDNLLIQEMSRAWFARFGEWCDHDWALRDGFVELNDRPGLGVELDEERLGRLSYDRPMLFRQYRHAET
jgi:L-alanine-DL-glutamate epimerase-like enolase superfamily enzyme